jgi:hypothetical protein
MQSKIKQKSRFYIFTLFAVYLLSQGGILLLPNAIYWDDWTLFAVDPEIVRETFIQAGAFFNWVGAIHNILLFFGPISYKYLTFILMFGSGLLFDNILKENFQVRIEEIFRDHCVSINDYVLYSTRCKKTRNYSTA